MIVPPARREFLQNHNPQVLRNYFQDNNKLRLASNILLFSMSLDQLLDFERITVERGV
jgi:hypothetical protein